MSVEQILTNNPEAEMYILRFLQEMQTFGLTIDTMTINGEALRVIEMLEPAGDNATIEGEDA